MTSAPSDLLPSPAPVMLIDPDGRPTDPAGFDPPPPADLLRAYAALVTARRFNDQAYALVRQGRLAVYPSSQGQEACQVAAALVLDAGDWLFPTYRDTAAVVARGVDPVEVLVLLKGDWHSGYDTRAHRVAPLATPLATQLLHAVGVAHAARLRGEPTVVMAMCGDGATSEGDFHEALNFAAVFRTPVVFFVQNNEYAISVPLARQSVAPSLAHKGIGYGIPGERVDGNDVAALLAVLGAAVAQARDGGGPQLIEAHTYRMQAHTNADDATRYRDQDEVAAWVARDPITRLATYLRERGALTDEAVADAAAAADLLAAHTRAGLNTDVEPRPDDLFDFVYARRTPQLAEQAALVADETRPGGVPMTDTRIEKLTMAQAINRALRDAMAADASVVVFGEDVGALGGVFRITDGLTDQFGDDRCFDTPLAESAIVGVAVGMAMNGMRPVVEMQFDAFAYPAFEQIVSHVAKMRNRTRGVLGVPMVIRVPYAGGIGGVEHHCDSSEAYYAHTPGLHVLAPANAADAYGLLRAAITSDDPVVFLEPKKLYWSKEEVDLSVPVPGIGTAAIVRAGTDATLIAYGPSVPTALAAAEVAAQEGRSLQVVDVRSIVPFDDETVCAAVRSTGRAVVVAEAAGFASVASEIVARVTERCFHSLAAPIRRVTGFDIPFPPPKLEHLQLPGVDRILDAVDDLQWGH